MKNFTKFVLGLLLALIGVSDIMMKKHPETSMLI